MCVCGLLSLFLSSVVALNSSIAAADSAHFVSYHRDISRLMQKHCVQCHHNDGVAPFSLESFEDVEASAPMIQEVIRRETMPPWFATPEADGGESPWDNGRILTDSEKEILEKWVKAGRPEGDTKDAPKPLKFPKGWKIEENSLYKARAVRVEATGIMPYEHILIDTNEAKDRWVDAIEIRPGAPQTVHHVLAFVVPPGGNSD